MRAIEPHIFPIIYINDIKTMNFIGDNYNLRHFIPFNKEIFSSSVREAAKKKFLH